MPPLEHTRVGFSARDLFGFVGTERGGSEPGLGIKCVLEVVPLLRYVSKPSKFRCNRAPVDNGRGTQTDEQNRFRLW